MSCTLEEDKLSRDVTNDCQQHYYFHYANFYMNEIVLNFDSVISNYQF